MTRGAEEDEHELVSSSLRPLPYPRTRHRVRIVAMVTYAVLLVLWSETLGIPNDTVQVFVWLWFGTIAWNIEARPRYHLNFVKDWWIPVAGLVIYFYTRGLTDELGLPVHVFMPIHVDEWIGFGQTPTERLQHALCGNPCVKESEPRWYDVLFTTTYATHFVTGLTIAAVLWVRNRAEWIKWMRRYVIINFGALVIYIAYPMAPPWMASEEGWLHADVVRITGRGWHDIGLGRFDLVLQGVGNPVAAMPSLHAGITFLIAIYGIQRLRTPWRWLLALYPLMMSTALVYYAEHYVVDVLAGALLAVAVLVGCQLWENSRDRAPRVTPRSTSPRG
ncbi:MULTISPECIES: phosphatase PAP2 family protein [unclassified Nocardioides]|uniref:phosphatase PAP2 family protein n=1 Tax=unclassified Nocardioides TaxID=2615069 RepID=UPI0009F0EDC3|nr:MULTISPECIES: phosphatase PAP2 family protein [unclassified Nocardioides]GAW52072.1 Phosphoesterase PA-phosphatase related protein [Nocardioides sp. PD653-B2]GAW57197.1 Phosphoesterase PA-phosphatase related protein [Nocardioides sp. PD653]